MFLCVAPCVRESSLKAVLVSTKLADRQNTASALKHPGKTCCSIAAMSRKLSCAGAFPGSDFHQVRCLFHAN